MPTRSTRAPRKDATQNKEAILAAAAALLNRDIDASLEAIAAEAGLSRRALYGHFSTRDALVGEVLVRGAQRISESLSQVSHPDARIEIALVGATLWAEIEHVRVMGQLALFGPYRTQVATALAPVRRQLLNAVTRGQDEGAIRRDLDADTTAHLIEGTALAVLNEATRTGMSGEHAHRLVMLAGLGAAGLDWRQAADLIESTPTVRFHRSKHDFSPTADAVEHGAARNAQGDRS